MNKLEERKAQLEHNLAHVNAEIEQARKNLAQLETTAKMMQGGILTLQEILNEEQDGESSTEGERDSTAGQEPSEPGKDTQ